MQNLLKTAVRGLSILMILRLFSKIIDFILNILVIREIDPQIYGLTIHFGLLLNLSLFYVKICLKNCYQKRSINPNSLNDPNLINYVIQQSSKNLMMFGVACTIVLTTVIGFIWSHLYSHLNPDFNTAIFIYCISAVISSMCEPILAYFVLEFDYKTTAQTEGVAMISKTIALFLFIKFNIFNVLVSFAAAQFIESLLSFSFAFLVATLKDPKGFTLFPKKIIESQKEYYVHKEMLDMSWQFTVISFLRFLLAEVEKLVLININRDPKVSAEFSLVSNICSLVPRYIFNPIEEISYNLFAKINQKTLSKEESLESKQIIILSTIFKLINIIGILASLFGFNYSYGLLKVLFGDKYTSDTCVNALKAYCIYIYIMGVNGISEAFLYGSIKEKDLEQYRKAIFGSTGFYLVACILLIQYGSVGLIVANCLSMIIRITICFIYLKVRILHEDGFVAFIQRSYPKAIFFLLFAITFFISFFITHMYKEQIFIQIIVGGLLFCINGFVLFKEYGSEIKELLRQKETKN